MRWHPKTRFDEIRIATRERGMGGRGLLLPIPGGALWKVGVAAIVVIILYVVLTQCIGDDASTNGDPTVGSHGVQRCSTGADAKASTDCEIDLVTNSVQAFWNKALPAQTGVPYVPIKTVTFSGRASSGCGRAAAQPGPFYCAKDQRLYLDSSFLTSMLRGPLHAEGGPFAVAYVIAHEYGHHIEEELGIPTEVHSHPGTDSDSTKAELMADCLAGVWAKNAQATTDHENNRIISDLTQQEVARAIEAAQAVGDDRTRKGPRGRVISGDFGRGTSARRIRWFDIGLSRGSVKACSAVNSPAR